jgi:hypothetical protein
MFLTTGSVASFSPAHAKIHWFPELACAGVAMAQHWPAPALFFAYWLQMFLPI